MPISEVFFCRRFLFRPALQRSSPQFPRRCNWDFCMFRTLLFPLSSLFFSVSPPQDFPFCAFSFPVDFSGCDVTFFFFFFLFIARAGGSFSELARRHPPHRYVPPPSHFFSPAASPRSLHDFPFFSFRGWALFQHFSPRESFLLSSTFPRLFLILLPRVRVPPLYVIAFFLCILPMADSLFFFPPPVVGFAPPSRKDVFGAYTTFFSTCLFPLLSELLSHSDMV